MTFVAGPKSHRFGRSAIYSFVTCRIELPEIRVPLQPPLTAQVAEDTYGQAQTEATSSWLDEVANVVAVRYCVVCSV